MIRRTFRALKFTGFVLMTKLFERRVLTHLKVLRLLSNDYVALPGREWLQEYSEIYGFHSRGEYVDAKRFSCRYVVAEHTETKRIHFIKFDWLNNAYRVHFMPMDEAESCASMLALLWLGRNLKELEAEWS